MGRKKTNNKSNYINKLYFGTKLVGTISLFEWIIIFISIIRRFVGLGTTTFYNKLLRTVGNDISKYDVFINNIFNILILVFLVIAVIYIMFAVINYKYAKESNLKIEKWLYCELFLAIILMLLPFVCVFLYNYI